MHKSRTRFTLWKSIKVSALDNLVRCPVALISSVLDSASVLYVWYYTDRSPTSCLLTAEMTAVKSMM